MTTLTVPSKFNGPPASGNGGYSCGVFAAAFDGPAAVSLRRPIPLDQPLEIQSGDGSGMGILARRELIAEVVGAPPLAPWSAPPVSLAEAHAAHAR